MGENDIYRFYDGGYEFFEEELRNIHFDEKELSYKSFKGAYCTPNYFQSGKSYGSGVIDSESNFIYGDNTVSKINSFDVENANVVHDKIIYLGIFQDIWGHVITDNIKRFWFLFSPKYKQQLKEYKFAFIPKYSYNDYRFKQIDELYEIFGLTAENTIIIDKITKFDEIIIPDDSFWNTDAGRRFTKEYRMTIDYIINNIEEPDDKSVYEKIYLTYKIKKIFGENNLEDFFISNGFKSVDPSELSLKRQIWIYQHCKVFAGLIGSSTHNVIFLKDGTDVILIPRSYYLTGYQVALNDLRDIRTIYIDSTLSNGVNNTACWNGPFFVFLSNELRTFFNSNTIYTKKDIQDLLSNYLRYIAFSKVVHFFHNIDAPKYYQERVESEINNYILKLNYSKLKIKIVFFFYKIKYMFLFMPQGINAIFRRYIK